MRRRPLPKAALPMVLALLAATLGASPVAHAYEEQLTLELGGVAAVDLVGIDPTFGGGAELVLTHGLGPAWSIGGSVRYLAHARDLDRHRLVPAVELLWQLDLLRVVPRIGLGLGPALAFGDARGADLDAYLRLGVDRVFDAGLLGFDVRTDALLLGGITGAGRVEVSFVIRWAFVIERY